MCNEIPFNVEKFPSPASVGTRALDSLMVKPAFNPHSATERIETKRQNDCQPLRRTDIQRETGTEREGEMKTVLLTMQQLHC